MDGAPRVDRRTFLICTGAVALSSASCTSPKAPPAGPAPTPAARAGTSLFDVLGEMRAALRASPDHLPERARQLVGRRDFKGLFELVRDRVITLPRGESGEFGFRGDDAMPWGPRGALRGGAGTPREKAELLATLFRDAGATDAAVVLCPYGSEGAPWPDHFVGPTPAYADVRIDPKQAAHWRRVLGTQAAKPPRGAVDPDGAGGQKLAAQVLSKLPAGAGGATGFRWEGPTPLVRATIDGKTVFANPHRPGAALGEAHCDTSNAQPAPSKPPQPVSVQVLAIDSHRLDQPRSLVSLATTTHEVVGAQILFKALPVLPTRELAVRRLQQTRVFSPSLFLQRIGAAPAGSSSATGSIITLAGETIEERAGVLTIDGTPLAATNPNARAAVKQLKLTVAGNQFPDVRLSLVALDGSGKPVAGLGAADLMVTEGSATQQAWLKANTSTPRVVALIDNSLSMPEAFAGEPAKRFIGELERAIVAAYPGAQVETRFTDSELWKNLAQAMAGDPTLIVYVTDGDVVGEESDYGAALKGNIPAVLVSVADRQRDVLERMAQLTGGAVVPATNQEEAKRKVLEQIGKRQPDPYQLTYTAPETGPEKRQVRVSVAGSSIAATASYRAPRPAPGPRRLVSLLIEVKWGDKTVRRLLAGWDPRTGQSELATQDVKRHAQAVHDMLNGTSLLTFEGMPPPAAVLLDDFLSAKLSVRPVVEARSGSLEDITVALEGGTQHLPATFVTLNLRPPVWRDNDSITYPTGLCVVLHREIPNTAQRRMERSVDILPLAGWRTAAADDALAFRRTAERTAHRAMVEATLFSESTSSLLAGKPLTHHQDPAFQQALAQLKPPAPTLWLELGRQAAGDPLVVPRSGQPIACWQVNRETGALVGLLPDGSGGATTVLQALDAQLAYLKVLAAAVGTSPALGAVAGYHQRLARMYAAVATAIDILDASQLLDGARSAVASMACGIAADLALPDLAGSLKDLIGSLTDIPC